MPTLFAPRLWVFGRRLPSIVAFSLVAAIGFCLPASSPRMFTREQALTGIAIYASKCAQCHGADLDGAAAPALSGAAFVHRWESGQRTVADLLHRIDSTMPLGAPRSLSTDDYLNVTAFILSRNAHEPGATELTETNAGVSLAAPNSSGQSSSTPKPTLPQV